MDIEETAFDDELTLRVRCPLDPILVTTRRGTDSSVSVTSTGFPSKNFEPSETIYICFLEIELIVIHTWPKHEVIPNPESISISSNTPPSRAVRVGSENCPLPSHPEEDLTHVKKISLRDRAILEYAYFIGVSSAVMTCERNNALVRKPKWTDLRESLRHRRRGGRSLLAAKKLRVQ